MLHRGQLFLKVLPEFLCLQEIVQEFQFFFFNVNAINNINVFPNPVNENIYINIDMKDNSDVSVRIIDLLGHLVYSTEVNNTTAQLQIPANDLKNGLYFVSVQTGDQVITKKIMVNRN